MKMPNYTWGFESILPHCYFFQDKNTFRVIRQAKRFLSCTEASANY